MYFQNLILFQLFKNLLNNKVYLHLIKITGIFDFFNTN